jgi:DNA mismatch endonuclease (patch repair protein)
VGDLEEGVSVADIVDRRRRSEIMARIGPRDTRPEMIVRSAAHRLGLRFRIHRKDLPGSPDLVFAKYGAVVFVHGCFWHRHSGCKNATSPKTRPDFWQKKFDGNVARDKRNLKELRRLGWRTVVIWECEAEEPERLDKLLRRNFPGLCPAERLH